LFTSLRTFYFHGQIDDQISRFPQSLFLAAREDDGGAKSGEFMRCTATDTAAAANNHDDLSVEKVRTNYGLIGQ
jgi:hypothetical protein